MNEIMFPWKHLNSFQEQSEFLGNQMESGKSESSGCCKSWSKKKKCCVGCSSGIAIVAMGIWHEIERMINLSD